MCLKIGVSVPTKSPQLHSKFLLGGSPTRGRKPTGKISTNTCPCICIKIDSATKVLPRYLDSLVGCGWKKFQFHILPNGGLMVIYQSTIHKKSPKKTNPYTSVLLRAPYQIWVGNYNSTCRGEQKPSWKIPVFTHWVPSAPLAANQPSWKPTCHNNPLPHPHHLRQKSGRLDMLTKCSTQKKNSTDSCFLLENKGNSLANLTIPYFWEEICSFVSL